MNRELAKRIVIETFESEFNKDKFIIFLKNLLKDYEEKTFIYRGNYIPDAFEQYINSFERIGKYTDGENEIDLLIVKLKRETSLTRARTAQRNFIAWYLKGSRGVKWKDAALVAFVSPDSEDWRFSLVKIDYKIEETPTGKIKVKEEFTPTKRWSFLVGRNEKSHTAQSRFVPLLERDEKPTLEELEEAFNVEVVTKEFFEKYRDLLILTVDALDNIIKHNRAVREDFESKNINTVEFAKKLLGQIVFLYFLQKKGWFGVSQDKKWGEGDKNFIRDLFEKCKKEKKNFFNNYLELLFYNTLNNPRSDQLDPTWSKDFNCKIPFLNGGLFEPIGGYDWVHTDILLPDELFSNSHRTPEGDIGDGILDVFDRFNFTVKEDEPLEKEVAIDPELLGKLYEKFNAIRPDNFCEYKKALASGKKSLEKRFNKKFGVYYTPREIVHYMCQQSLIYYLESSTGIPACDDIHITRRNLPHWTKTGAIYWITFRLSDSLPQEKIETWKKEYKIWEKSHPKPWTEQEWQEYNEKFGKRFEKWIDAGYGSCILARDDVREKLKECIMKFDGERLRVHSAVIMPNHVHILLEPISGYSLSELLKGIKGTSAREINKLLGTTGKKIWMEESYDHIVRSEAQYLYFLKYIMSNPAKANLSADKFWLYQSNTGISACEGRNDNTLKGTQTRMSVLRSAYNFKRECIENSIYGVDIDAGACEVAKLRLWLSLIVDEEDIKKIKPLPNLDYKIVCGNSLLGVEKDLFNIELFNQLEKLKPLYFNETNPTKKQEYKSKIEELISKITKGRKEFDFEVYFSEVFHEKGGFDW